MSILIFWRHPEILNKDERGRFYKILGNATAAHAFVALVQIPLSMLYCYRLLKKPKEFRYLQIRLLAFPLFSIPWMFYSTHAMTGMSDELHEKYLSDLSDHEIENFRDIYQQSL